MSKWVKDEDVVGSLRDLGVFYNYVPPSEIDNPEEEDFEYRDLESVSQASTATSSVRYNDDPFLDDSLKGFLFGFVLTAAFSLVILYVYRSRGDDCLVDEEQLIYLLDEIMTYCQEMGDSDYFYMNGKIDITKTKSYISRI